MQIAGQNTPRVPLKRLSANATEIFQVNGNLIFSASILGDSVETRHWEATGRNQKITVQFHSSVCRSVLKTDVSEIVFEDCVPGGVFVKDFSVWNLSEIRGSFELNVKCGPSEKPVCLLSAVLIALLVPTALLFKLSLVLSLLSDIGVSCKTCRKLPASIEFCFFIVENA